MPVIVKPGAGELDGQRQADVAEADDADARGAALEFVAQGLGERRKRGWVEFVAWGVTSVAGRGIG